MLDIIESVVTSFPVQLIIAESLFLSKLQRKKDFLKIYLPLTLGLVLLYLLVLGQWKTDGINILFSVLFVLSVFIIKLATDNSLESILFCCVGAYAMQHLAFNLVCSFWILRNMDGFGTLFNTGLYVWGDYDIFQWGWYAVPVYIGIYAIAYGLCYYFFIRRLNSLEVMEFKNIFQVVLGLGIVVFTFGISAIFCCIMVLILQFGLISREALLREQNQMEAMLQLSARQQQIAKDNIDVINIKCHDLRKQIETLKKLPDYKSSLNEIEQAIDIYDSVVETGNEALDIVLTEKSLLCESLDIRFTYMVDGEALAFMGSSDIYALFGNALDNAIEAVRYADIQNRIITLRIYNKNKQLIVMMDNYCRQRVMFKNGFPVTTKNDSNYHGFGTKSIAYIAKKYNGYARMYQEDNRFGLEITIPLAHE